MAYNRMGPPGRGGRLRRGVGGAAEDGSTDVWNTGGKGSVLDSFGKVERTGIAGRYRSNYEKELEGPPSPPKDQPPPRQFPPPGGHQLQQGGQQQPQYYYGGGPQGGVGVGGIGTSPQQQHQAGDVEENRLVEELNMLQQQHAALEKQLAVERNHVYDPNLFGNNTGAEGIGGQRQQLPPAPSAQPMQHGDGPGLQPSGAVGRGRGRAMGRGGAGQRGGRGGFVRKQPQVVEGQQLRVFNKPVEPPGGISSPTGVVSNDGDRDAIEDMLRTGDDFAERFNKNKPAVGYQVGRQSAPVRSPSEPIRMQNPNGGGGVGPGDGRLPSVVYCSKCHSQVDPVSYTRQVAWYQQHVMGSQQQQPGLPQQQQQPGLPQQYSISAHGRIRHI